MVNMTLSLPDKLHKKMREFPEIKWAEIARRAIEQRVTDLKTINQLASKSKLTKQDVEELSKKIKAGATRRFLA